MRRSTRATPSCGRRRSGLWNRPVRGLVTDVAETSGDGRGRGPRDVRAAPCVESLSNRRVAGAAGDGVRVERSARGSRAPGLLEQLLGVGGRALAAGQPGEHPRELLDALGVLEDADGGGARPPS